MAINYLEIKKQIRQKLSKPIDFEDTDNLLELGLSSLVIMKLVNQWRKQGIKISFGVLMEHPTLREWWELIQKTLEKADSKKRTAKKEKRIMADMYQEFPLTDVQYAYWVGRDERQALGGIGCHAYLEFDGKAVDQSRLRHAWAVVQQHHPMLRACFLNNGAQKILAKPYKGELKINDYSSMQEEEAQRAALSIRNRLSHRKLHIEKGEVAGLELTLLPHGKTRLHIDVETLCLNGSINKTMLAEINQLNNNLLYVEMKKFPESIPVYQFLSSANCKIISTWKELHIKILVTDNPIIILEGSHYLHLEQKDSIVNHIIKWIRDLDEGKRNCSK